MLILSAADVREALPMADAVIAMKQAFAAYSSGQVEMPPRTHLNVGAHQATSLIMPSYMNDGKTEALATKVASLFPGNPKRDLAFIQAAVMAFEPDTGRLQAVLEGGSLTAIRTGAASGVATDLLAASDASAVAIIGAGAQARTQLEGVCTVRRIQTAWIYSRTPAKVEALIAELAGKGAIPSDLRCARSAREAVMNADIVCTATASTDRPVFDDADLKSGVHINAVGSFQPHVCEIPLETIARSWVVVDSRAESREEAGDLIQPIDAGIIGWDHVRAEVGELIAGSVAMPENDHDVPTLFKSVGMAVQDGCAAQVALTNAKARGLGTEVPW